MANITSGTSVSASGFNDLFTRLETVRSTHLNASGQTAAAKKSALKDAFTTTIAAVGSKPVPSNVQQIKTDLEVLANSKWLDDTFSSQITIPATGDLLSINNFNLYDNVITEVEAVCTKNSSYWFDYYYFFSA